MKIKLKNFISIALVTVIGVNMLSTFNLSSSALEVDELEAETYQQVLNNLSEYKVIENQENKYKDILKNIDDSQIEQREILLRKYNENIQINKDSMYVKEISNKNDEVVVIGFNLEGDMIDSTISNQSYVYDKEGNLISEESIITVINQDETVTTKLISGTEQTVEVNMDEKNKEMNITNLNKNGEVETINIKGSLWTCLENCFAGYGLSTFLIGALYAACFTACATFVLCAACFSVAGIATGGIAGKCLAKCE